MLCALLITPLGGGEIKRAVDAPLPLAPEESAKRFQVEAGFRIELVAAEPLLADPVAMAFDARGRIFVCEIHGYNLEGQYDVDELNKTGVLDTKVQRIFASQKAIERAEKGTYGTVKLLLDENGDGRMDREQTWADRLPPTYGIVPAGDGIIVLCAPEIIYLSDRDGDDHAEVRETLFTGFGVGELWTRINNPRWGLDNWIYGACGAGSAGTIRGPRLGAPVELGNTGFRFKADGSSFEPVSGGTSGFGQATDDWGNRFLVTNQEHAIYVAPLEHRYLARNPYYPGPNLLLNISSYGHPAQVYPSAPPDPWRVARSKQPEWVKFYGENETTMGLMTAACAPLIYRGGGFPKDYEGNHFSCDAAYNLVHRAILEADGAAYKARRGLEKAEFVASSEQWFRPINLTLGPEGAIYIVDMYREIIEDYTAIPRYLQQQYGLTEGHDKGRIWRVVHEGHRPARSPDLARLGTEELVAELGNKNAWWRETAQRLLIERREPETVASLRAFLGKDVSALGRLHGFYTLAGLGALEPALVESALSDPHAGVRWHGVRLAEAFMNQERKLLDKVVLLSLDPDPRVRIQVALSLGETEDPGRWEPLAKLAADFGTERWMEAAIVSSLANGSGKFLSELASRRVQVSSSLLEALAGVVASRQDAEELDSFLEMVSGCDDGGFQTRCLVGFARGLERRKPESALSTRSQTALFKLMSHLNGEVQAPALRAAGVFKFDHGPELLSFYRQAAKEALDGSRPLAGRKASLARVGNAPFTILGPTVEEILEPRQPSELQIYAAGMLGTSSEAEASALLLRGWKQYSPQVWNAVLEVMFRNRTRLSFLVEALERGEVSLAGIDSARRQQLLSSPDAGIRERAKKLLNAGRSEPEGNDWLTSYQRALKEPGDRERGKGLFQEHCVRCHSLRGEGGRIGPDLSTTKGRAMETLLIDVLEPSVQITAGFSSYNVLTKGGDIHSGILSAESATSLTMPREDGTEEVILRLEIERMELSEVSLMPSNFRELLSPEDLANLLSWITAAGGAP